MGEFEFADGFAGVGGGDAEARANNGHDGFFFAGSQCEFRGLRVRAALAFED